MELAKREGVELRQSYLRLAKRAAIMVGPCHQGHPPRDAPARRHRTRHRSPNPVPQNFLHGRPKNLGVLISKITLG
ncbi:MAG: hypothetical protein JO012_16345 [Hyphomicrobiales bacterium]|nr:hypothetical protein [Hyphomicrobiales bacterium]